MKEVYPEKRKIKDMMHCWVRAHSWCIDDLAFKCHKILQKYSVSDLNNLARFFAALKNRQMQQQKEINAILNIFFFPQSWQNLLLYYSYLLILKMELCNFRYRCKFVTLAQFSSFIPNYHSQHNYKRANIVKYYVLL